MVSPGWCGMSASDIAVAELIGCVVDRGDHVAGGDPDRRGGSGADHALDPRAVAAVVDHAQAEERRRADVHGAAPRRRTGSGWRRPSRYRSGWRSPARPDIW